MASSTYHQAEEGVLVYHGLRGTLGLCHMRLYESGGRLPVAIVGELADNPGTTVVGAIEAVAAALDELDVFKGREFRLIAYEPAPIESYQEANFEIRGEDDELQLSDLAGAMLTFQEDGSAVAHGPLLPGRYRRPTWTAFDPVTELGRELPVHVCDTYTAAHCGADHTRERICAHNLAVLEHIRTVERLARDQ